MPTHQTLKSALDNAPAITYSSAAATVTLWGLHVADFAALIAALASVLGVALQFYVAMHRIRQLERGLEANNIVTTAQGKATRALDQKIEETR
jgi:hypothetical protein